MKCTIEERKNCFNCKHFDNLYHFYYDYSSFYRCLKPDNKKHTTYHGGLGQEIKCVVDENKECFESKWE